MKMCYGKRVAEVKKGGIPQAKLWNSWETVLNGAAKIAANFRCFPLKIGRLPKQLWFGGF